MNIIIDDIKRLVEKLMGNDFAHGYPHVARVRRYAWLIVDNEGLNIDETVLELAVLLHDIGRRIGEPHAYYSALLARSILAEKGVPANKIEKITNAILYHSFSYARRNNIEPLSDEAKVLSDADKLDALGVVGLVRVFLFGAEHNRGFEDSIKHFREKIFRLKDLMHYQYSRRLARELTMRTRKALEMLLEETGYKEQWKI